jgi:hypothetical protein
MPARTGRARRAGRFTLLGGTTLVAAIPVAVGYRAVAALVVALFLRVIDLHACLLAKKAVARFSRPAGARTMWGRLQRSLPTAFHHPRFRCPGRCREGILGTIQ